MSSSRAFDARARCGTRFPSSRLPRRLLVAAFVAALVVPGGAVLAVINAALQPVDLFGRYKAVVACEVVSIDEEATKLTLHVTRTLKGEMPGVVFIEVDAQGDQEAAFTGLVRDGQLGLGTQVAAFVGQRRRRLKDDLIFYFGKAFYMGKRVSPTKWNWTKGDTQLVGIDGEKIPTLAGTWFGSTHMLIEMLGDISRGASHFPRKAYARFKEDMLLDDFDGASIRGVALYDIDSDGDLDVYACSDVGDRIYLQMEPMVFVNATDWMDLDVAGTSCSFADVNADGRADLLLGGEIRLGGFNGDKLALEYSEVMPPEFAIDVKSSAYVELNGDGYPDVVLSVLGDGLRAVLNPGEKGGEFIDASERMGLRKNECGAGKEGFFAAGDWNGDHRTDLFFAAGKGYLLVQNEDGVFEPLDHDIPFIFLSGEDDEPGLTGAGCFAQIMQERVLDLVVPTESSWHVVENRLREPVDVTEYGNEISEGSFLHLATIAVDLNLDGYLDLYTVSRAEKGHNRYIINRGYGSFMLASAHKSYDYVFKGPAHSKGGWGVASGDVDGDGAPDLLVGNLTGQLSIIRNDTLATRAPSEHPIDDIARLEKMRVLDVDVRGPLGVVGALVELRDAEGGFVARRNVGLNVASGCRGPDAVMFVAPRAGDYSVVVRYADGFTEKRRVNLTDLVRKVQVNRDAP